ncbi:hypothetical protein FQZ97_758530 [compost metagenome]
MHLHIHLNGRNTLFSTGHLEVHVTGKVFGISNITHDIRCVTVHHKTHCNTGNRSFQWYASIH